MTTQSLDGPWQFRLHGAPKGDVPRGLDLTRWRRADMPGTLHFALQKHGVIPDAFVGRNELDVQWVDAQDWEIRRSMRVSQDEVLTARQQLVFEGIDTVAEIFVNGRHAGSSCNMFRETVVDVKGRLQPGDNEVRLLLKSPSAYAKSMSKKSRVPMPRMSSHFEWQTGESREIHRAWIRKTQCHFGWDWGPCLPVSGLWRPCRLECSDQPRIASVTSSQVHRGTPGSPRCVELRLEARLQAGAPGKGALYFECAGRGKRVAVSLKKGENVVRARLTVERPRLWWPAGQGEQHLYELRVTWSDASGAGEPVVRHLGLRTLELVTKKDRTPEGRPAESFFFRVNGRPIFLKGADFIPADAYVDRCTPEVYRHLLVSMVEANMNAVRPWGGGWYEQDLFYDLCDELGLLVWQDFMMACSVYPDTPEMLREFEAEVRYQVRRLQSHPCIALWCGDNENLSGLKHWWLRMPHAAAYRRMYIRIMGLVGKTCQAEDPTRRFWISSPSNGSLSGDPDDPDRGDIHYWKVWHGGRPFSDYLTVRPRFVAEFGFQSFPSPATVAAVVPPGERNPSSFFMEHHQRSPEGIARLSNTLARELPMPRDFDSFCWLSQVNQANAIRTAVEHWRRLKPWCMGTIFWQVNDNWPVASWSSIDHCGRWKALHHEVARVFAPLLVSLVVRDKTLEVWATSDLPRTVRLKGTLRVMDWSGKGKASRPLTVVLGAGVSRRIAAYPLETLTRGCPAREVCAFVALEGSGLRAENYLNLVPWKWAKLAEPRFKARLRDGRDGRQLVVKTGTVVPFLHADLKGQEGHFAGDWGVLRSGRTYRFPWIPHEASRKQPLSLAAARRRLRLFTLWDLFAHGTGPRKS